MAIATAKVWSIRSEDPYRKVGCCILNKNGRVLSVGYNGLPSKFSAAGDFWKDRDSRRKYMLHAEINALSLIRESDDPNLLACTLLPCPSCATAIIAHGIKNVIYIDNYESDSSSIDIFEYYNINIKKYEI